MNMDQQADFDEHQVPAVDDMVVPHSGVVVTSTEEDSRVPRVVQREGFGPWSVELNAPLAETVMTQEEPIDQSSPQPEVEQPEHPHHETRRVSQLPELKEKIRELEAEDEEKEKEEEEWKDESPLEKLGHAIKETAHQVSEFSKQAII